MRAKLFFPAFLVLMVSVCYAANAPPPIDAGILEYGKSYTFKLTFINPENYSQDIILNLTPRSWYLDKFTTLSPNRFTLGSKETKTINVIVSVDENMPPGKHTLTILPEEQISGEGTVTQASRVAEITFNLPGQVLETAELKSMAVINGGDGLKFELTVKNTGNVRIGAFPSVELRRYYGYNDATIKTLKGTTQYLIEPGQETVLVVGYDAALEKGSYKAIGKANYQDKSTNEIFKTFTMGQSIIKDKPKNPSNPVSSSGAAGSSKPGNDFPIINIGGGYASNDGGSKTTGNASNDSKEKTSSIELRISQLETRAVAKGAVSILLGLENIYETKAPYKVRVRVFNESEEMTEEFEQRGEIEGSKTELIEFAGQNIREGNYRIEALLEYANKTSEKIYLATIKFSEGAEGSKILGDYSRLTGKFISGVIENKTTILLMLVAILLLIIYLRGDKFSGK